MKKITVLEIFCRNFKNIKDNKYSFYHKRMEHDVIFRSNLT